MPTAEVVSSEVARWFQNPTVFVRNSDLPSGCPVPAEWKELLGLSGSKLHDGLSHLWHNVNDVLPEAATFVAECVTDVSIVRDEGDYSLLYAYQNSAAKRRYYVGWLPNNGQPDAKIAPCWNLFPSGLKQFLVNVHDGWMDLASYALGPLPTRMMSLLSEPEWDLAEGPEVALGWQWNNILTTLANGAGDYLCLDLGNCLSSNEAKCHVHLHTQPLQPERQYDFLSVLNAWVRIGVENAVPR